MPLMAHLRELRVRLFRAVLAIVLCMIGALFFYKPLFEVVAHPFQVISDESAARGENVTLNFQGIVDPFTLQLKICALAGVLIASPVWLYQLWAFVTPGLHRHERRWAMGFLAASVPLFLGGTYLAYVLLPKGFEILIGFNPDPEDVANIIGLNQYLSFVIRMMLVFGFSFVMPVFLVALNLVGVVKARQLLGAWRAVTLGLFVFAAVATPTGDFFSMTALAVPLLALYFGAIGVCAIIDRRRRRAGIDGLDYDALDDDSASPLDDRPDRLDDADDGSDARGTESRDRRPRPDDDWT